MEYSFPANPSTLPAGSVFACTVGMSESIEVQDSLLLQIPVPAVPESCSLYISATGSRECTRRGPRWRALAGLATLCTTGAGIVWAVACFSGGSALPLVPALGKFLVLADFHLDQFYVDSLAARPCLCHPRPAHACIAASHAPYGRYGCDSPYSLVASAVAAAQAALPDPDFVVVLGDMVRHGAHELARPRLFTLAAISNVTALVESAFPNAPRIHHMQFATTFGNNDLEPSYFINVSSKCDQPFLADVAELWAPLLSLDAGAAATLACGGYYNVTISASLTLIALNTILYSVDHKPPSAEEADPLGQFAWLREQLTSARDRHSIVYVISHVAPGHDHYSQGPLWHDIYLETYVDLISEFHDVVRAQLYGHEHKNTFRLFPEGTDVSAPVLIPASVSPVYGNIPTFWVVEYDKHKGDLLDFTVWGAPVDVDATTEPAWSVRFSGRAEFGLGDLSSGAFRSFLLRMQANTTLFGLWLNHTTDGIEPTRSVSCDVSDAACRRRVLCGVAHMRATDFLHCSS